MPKNYKRAATGAKHAIKLRGRKLRAGRSLRRGVGKNLVTIKEKLV